MQDTPLTVNPLASQYMRSAWLKASWNELHHKPRDHSQRQATKLQYKCVRKIGGCGSVQLARTGKNILLLLRLLLWPHLRDGPPPPPPRIGHSHRDRLEAAHCCWSAPPGKDDGVEGATYTCSRPRRLLIPHRRQGDRRSWAKTLRLRGTAELPLAGGARWTPAASLARRRPGLVWRPADHTAANSCW